MFHRHGTSRHDAPLLMACLTIVQALLFSSCTSVRSLEPAVDSAHAESHPELVGRWEIRDSATLEVRVDSGHAPRLIFELRDLTDTTSARRGPDGRPRPLWYSAYIGRLAGRSVIDLAPATDDDPALGPLTSAYAPLILPVHMVVGLELDRDGAGVATAIRLATLSTDSLEARVPPVLRRPGCASPYRFTSRGHLLLTGSTAETRAAYVCFIRAWGFSDSAVVFRRTR